MTDTAHNPLPDAFAHLRQVTQSHAATALRPRAQSAHQQHHHQPYDHPPLSDSRDSIDERTATTAAQQHARTDTLYPQAHYAAVVNGRDDVRGSERRARSTSADGAGKGGGSEWSDTAHHYHGHQPSVVVPRKEQQRAPTMTTARATSHEQREQQRQRQMELARRMAAASTASSTSAAYMEMVSPVRPLEAAHAVAQDRLAMANGRHKDSQSPRATNSGSAPGARRREAPSRIMQEFDNELAGSAGEHERLSVGISHDAGETEDQDDADDEADDVNQDTQEDSDTETPPVVAVRVHLNDQRGRSYPTFREEISSDASEHVGVQSPPLSSTDTDRHAYFPASGELYSIPSISLTPPASPSRHQTHNQHHSGQEDQMHGHHASNGSQNHADPVDTTARGDWPVGAEVLPLPKGFFSSSWTIGFATGCLVAGFGGMFLEEFMEYFGVYLKTTSFTLSRAEQREMNRRLDVLQEELLNFRASTNDIEHQSQRMVQEVRSHLVKMKTERERHQQMIANEMDTLRLYVQAITNELVENEKKEIRKRLMDTIAETAVAEQTDKASRHESTERPRIVPAAESGRETTTEPKQVEIPVEVEATGGLLSSVKVEIEAAAHDEAASLFDALDEASVMVQIDRAISSVSPAIQERVVSSSTSNDAGRVTVDTSYGFGESSFSWELFALIVGMGMIAAAVGTRVHSANRRKTDVYRSRRLWRQPQDTAKPPVTGTSDDSEIETVEFFRIGSESGLDDREVEDSDADEHDDDGDSSLYSEEQRKSELSDDAYAHEEDRVSTSSYEFQAAQPSEENSEVEPIDESSSFEESEPPTPHRRTSKQQHQQLEDRLVDEAPVRRSPRLHGRSTLNLMR